MVASEIEIINWIDAFKKKYWHQWCEYFFTSWWCYIFAEMLEITFNHRWTQTVSVEWKIWDDAWHMVYKHSTWRFFDIRWEYKLKSDKACPIDRKTRKLFKEYINFDID